MRQKRTQSHSPPKICAMPMGPLSDLEAETSPWKILPKARILIQTTLKASLVPLGIASANVYSTRSSSQSLLANPILPSSSTCTCTVTGWCISFSASELSALSTWIAMVSPFFSARISCISSKKVIFWPSTATILSPIARPPFSAFPPSSRRLISGNRRTLINWAAASLSENLSKNPVGIGTSIVAPSRSTV